MSVGWISRCCGAYCGQDEYRCWNCADLRRRHSRQDTPDATTFTETCIQCGEEYLGVTDGIERIALCPHYFEHNLPGVYYPPNFRPDLLAELNGYYLEDGGVAVKKPDDERLAAATVAWTKAHDKVVYAQHDVVEARAQLEQAQGSLTHALAEQDKATAALKALQEGDS